MTSPSLRRRMEDLGPQPDNKNTLKKTKFDLRIVQAYLQRAREERPLLAVPVEELDAHLAAFIRTHRKQDGSEYEPGTLRGILGSLDRHFERCGYPHAIYRSRDTKFLRTVAAMKEKQSYLKTLGKGGHPPQAAEPLTEREIELLYATGAIGLHNPTALLYTLFFNIGLHFSLRTMEQHNLKWGDITLKADARGRKYLEHAKRLSGGRGGGGKFHPSHAVRMQIYESPEQPERDVVKAYEKYAAERPEKMKCQDAPFYLTPQPDCRPGYARWFKNLPMGESRIRGIMKHLKVAAGLPPNRKILGRPTGKSPLLMGGGGAASILSAQVKALRGETSLNGRRSNGVVVKKEEEDSYGQDDSLDTEGGYNALGIRRESGKVLPSGMIGSSNLTRIKEEWESEEVSAQGVGMGEKSLIPGQGSVTFRDVAACFSAEEWSALEDWQKELYKNVMREIHSAMEAMGYKIVNTDVLLKIKDEECDKKSPSHEKSSASASGRSISPDILLRIKQDEVPDWRDMEETEKEEELDNSSIPVFDPDLSMWIFKESPDGSLPEDERDPAADSASCPDDGVSILHSTPSAYKGPLPEISTLRRPICPELPRPGKRKRRPPQRRASEHQQPDSDADEEKRNHRLPCRNPPAPAEERKERMYQCDLCERTFSDLCNLQEEISSCPQCGGSLNPLPNQTLDPTQPSPHSGFSHPRQGPVG